MGNLLFSSLINVLSKTIPDEIYNLAAQSHVLVSFSIQNTHQTLMLGLIRLLESVRALKLKTKIYQASASEMYGNNNFNKSIGIKNTISPVSPYGREIMYCHLSEIYKKAYGMFICNGIYLITNQEKRGKL